MSSDLRGFLRRIEDIGELQVVRGANWDLEIGAITELVAEKAGPALLFDDIKGVQRGFRVLTNTYGSYKRTAIGVNLPIDLDPMGQIVSWRARMKKYRPVPPVEVTDGPIFENQMLGDEVDILKFPTPKWHQYDGGRFIGTGDATITREPDSNFVNLGVYRIQVHDKSTLSLMAVPGKHARIAIDKYHAMGKSAPVAVTFGHDPVFWSAAAFPAPYGSSEYDLAGFMREEPVKVVKGKITGLPIPADAEIAIEGEIPPISEDSLPEGPFGEWSGYYTGTYATGAPKLKIKAVYYRNDPVILGQPPLKPPAPMHWAVPFEAAEVWNELEAAGIQDVTGVWQPLTLWGPLILVISIKQRYIGQAKQTALAAAGCRKGSWGGRFVIVVDEDIDITNNDEVLWAMATRCDGANIDIIKNVRTSVLDPMTGYVDGETRLKKGVATAKVLIDACKPIEWLDKFPRENVFDQDYRAKISQKWSNLMPSLATYLGQSRTKSDHEEKKFSPAM